MLIALVVWGAGCALHLLDAAHHLEDGVNSAQAVQGELSTADIATTPAGPDLAVASTDFTLAHREIASAWVQPLRILPWVGRQVHALDDLSGAASTVTTSSHQALVAVQAILATPHETPPERAVAIGRLASTLDRLDRQVTGVHLGPANALLPALAAKRNIFVGDLNQLDSGLTKGAGAADAVADLLNNHRTYLILTANNAEMRDGQGMFLQAGTVTSKGGRLTLGSFRATGDLTSAKPLVRVGGDLAARFPKADFGTDYRNLGLSPQFELNAPVAAAMWKAQTGISVDGVLVIDVVALKDLLAVTGPVSGQGVTVDAGDVEQTLFLTQYQGDNSDAANAARREGLGVLAAAVFDSIQQQGTSLPKLANALDQAVDGRNLLAWSPRPALEADWRAAGADGQLRDNDLLLGVSNVGVNKLDPYQQVSTHLSFQAHGADTQVTLTAKVSNESPTGLPSYVSGVATDGIVPYRYEGYLTLDLPAFAGDVRVTGGPVVSSGADGPSNLVAVVIQLPRLATVTVTWTFLLVGHHGSLQVDPSARAPTTTWVTPSRTFTDDTAHTVKW